MKRRALLHATAAFVPLGATAQSGAGPRRLCVLSPFTRHPAREAVTRDELARLGWRIDDNLMLHQRFSDGQSDRLDALARELVALEPTVLLGIGVDAVKALRAHTRQIPIIAAFAPDPVAEGWAASLRRPGGQVSGITMMSQDIRPKLFELARVLVPQARRLIGMHRALAPSAQIEAALDRGRQLGRQAGTSWVPLPVQSAADIEPAMRSIVPAREHVLLINADELLYAQFARIAALARALRLASGSQNLDYVRGGGLFGYGPDLEALLLRSLQMIDQVLRGRAVGEIPFEQPTRISLVVNRGTAREIGLTLSKEVLLLSDEVIE